MLACLNNPIRKAAYIDLSMTDLLFTWTGLKAGRFYNQGLPIDPDLLGEPHYGVFKTKDHKYVALGVIEDHFWEEMCEYLGWDDFLCDSNFNTYLQRFERRSVILPRLRETLSRIEQDQLVNDLLSMGVPCSWVHSAWVQPGSLSFE
ncbi:CoA transferase [Neobacillus sp. BF23-41]|uniref:CoA transferase n=1 Tax=Neobacillus sp. BF23-41 TaxID=3240280 RepID=UPI0034E53BDC